VASIRGQSRSVASGRQSQVAAAANTHDALALIDLPGVSRETLGQHWTQLTPTQQDEFTTLFAQLLIRIAFPQSAAFFRELEVHVTDERIRGQQATVTTYVKHAIEGRINIDYRLIQRGNTWLIHDIQLDGVSLNRNLRAQFHQIIRKTSYTDLLQRMRDKLAKATAAAS
jgi:phospholipid transport system substrate-binding protein